jgi:hypothetical protein
MRIVPSLVYLLCFLTSFVAMLLIYRAYLRNRRTRLLLWSALAFVALAVNNLLLFLDVVILPDSISLLPYRHLSALTAVGLLLYGFVWEVD